MRDIKEHYGKMSVFVRAHAAEIGFDSRPPAAAPPPALFPHPIAHASPSSVAAPQWSLDDDLATFVAKQGLPPHVLGKLQAEDIDTVATLALVTEEDLVEIGIALGPRRKLLIAIAALNAGGGQ